MRHLIRFGFVAGALVLAAPAHAETRIFIVANNADGYGVDRCLATGASCGSAVASAFCRAREFIAARSYRRVEHSEITGAVPADEACRVGCDGYVAIECTR